MKMKLFIVSLFTITVSFNSYGQFWWGCKPECLETYKKKPLYVVLYEGADKYNEIIQEVVEKRGAEYNWQVIKYKDVDFVKEDKYGFKWPTENCIFICNTPEVHPSYTTTVTCLTNNLVAIPLPIYCGDVLTKGFLPNMYHGNKPQRYEEGLQYLIEWLNKMTPEKIELLANMLFNMTEAGNPDPKGSLSSLYSEEFVKKNITVFKQKKIYFLESKNNDNKFIKMVENSLPNAVFVNDEKFNNAIANRANDVIIEYNGFLIDLETELPIYYTYLVVWQKQLGKLIAE